MDLATLRQQILSSNKTANEKAEDLLLEHRVNDLSKDEWRQLIAGIPEDVKKEIGRLKAAAVRTLDDVTIISEATARAFHRLKQEEESEQEETTCCTTSSTPFAMAEAAARKLGFQVKTLDCDLAPNAHVHPLQPVYVWEQNEDSAHEKAKVLARLNEELALSNKELQATAVFAKPLAVGHPGAVEQIIANLGTEDYKGSPVVLSDLTEASVFQRGTGPHDIIHVHFKNLEEAYAHIQWLLDRSKAENPDLRLDTSLASPAVGMFTIMEHQAQSETDSMSADDRFI
ncbi:TPA: hypothetical protein ACH3X2_012202 [Trebouxia sp. C0005]